MLPAENLDNKIKELWPKNGPSIQEVKKYVKKYSKEKIVIKCGGKGSFGTHAAKLFN